MNKAEAKKRYENLKADAQLWVPTWMELSSKIDNTRGRFNDPTVNDGQKVNGSTILSSVSKKALNTMAAGMFSGLTSPAQKWFRTGLPDMELMSYEPVKAWLELLDDRMMAVFGMSNIYSSFYSMYLELGQFGTACGIIDEDFSRVINTKVFTCGEYFIGRDSRGEANQLARPLNMKAEQIVDEFGKQVLEGRPDLQRLYNEGKTDRQRVYHLVVPNKNREPGKIDNKNMAYLSMFWLGAGSDDDAPLSIGGYNECPFFAPTWDAISSDVYGRGPAWQALSDIKQHYQMEKNKLFTLEVVSKPPLQFNASNIGQTNLVPGGVSTFSDTNPNAGIRPAYQVTTNLEAQQRMIDIIKYEIKENFYVDLFKTLEGIDRADIKAREIAERHEQALLLLGPILLNVEDGGLRFIIERGFGILVRNGMLPPPPPELAGMDLNIEYISPLAQAQKLVAAQGIERGVNFIGQMAAIKPDVMDILDADEAVFKYTNLIGTPKSIIKSKEDVAVIRNQRAKAQQAQSKLLAAQQIAETAATAAKAKTVDGRSVIDAMAGNPTPVGSAAPTALTVPGVPQ